MKNDNKPSMWTTFLTIVLALAVCLCAIYFSRGCEAQQKAESKVVASPVRSVDVATEPVRRMMRITAYCPCSRCCGKFADGVTASGKPVTFNGGKFVAAPSDIPFGTLVSIPGYGTVPVEDRGGAIKGNRLDVFFPTHEEALEWGVHHLEVEIAPSPVGKLASSR